MLALDRARDRGRVLVHDHDVPAVAVVDDGEVPVGDEVLHEHLAEELHAAHRVVERVQRDRRPAPVLEHLGELGGEIGRVARALDGFCVEGDLDLGAHALCTPHVDLAVDAGRADDAIDDGKAEPRACLEGVLL